MASCFVFPLFAHTRQSRHTSHETFSRARAQADMTGTWKFDICCAFFHPHLSNLTCAAPIAMSSVPNVRIFSRSLSLSLSLSLSPYALFGGATFNFHLLVVVQSSLASSFSPPLPPWLPCVDRSKFDPLRFLLSLSKIDRSPSLFRHFWLNCTISLAPTRPNRHCHPSCSSWNLVILSAAPCYFAHCFICRRDFHSSGVLLFDRRPPK